MKTDEERFWAKVDKRGPDECWEWLGCRHWRGHGQAFVEGKVVYAHRYSLQLALGRALTDGAMACHHCDNPPCVYPAHLYEGDSQTNVDDMWRRGRANPWGGRLGAQPVETACGVCGQVFKSPQGAGSHEKRSHAPIPHGTDAGFMRHRSRGEAACSDCHSAHLAARRDREARRSALSRVAS